MSIWHPTVTPCCSRRSAERVRVDPVAANGWNKTVCRLAARCAAVVSIGAAVIHFGVAPMHGRDWLPSG